MRWRTRRWALPKGKVNRHVPAGNILWMDTTEACLEAVRSGQADYTYGNGYLVQYYLNQPRFHGLQSITQSSSVEKTCVGVVKPANVNLLTVLNKAVGSMPETELQAMLYQSTQDTSARVTFRSFIESNPIQTLLCFMGHRNAVYRRPAVDSDLQDPKQPTHCAG